MSNLNASMRLKIQGDVFYLPDHKGGVYLRNNQRSFRIEGSQMDLWVEKLIPFFSGEYSLSEIAEGLSQAHQKRVYEIAEILYKYGFVRDISRDLPDELSEAIRKKYAPQIEFVDHLVHSGAYLFQRYRQSNILSIGSDSIFVSLISALFESGLKQVHAVMEGLTSRQQQRILELTEHYQKDDPELSLREVYIKNDIEIGWREIIEPFDTVLFASSGRDIELLKLLHNICRQERKNFLPAIHLQQFGMVGPLVHPGSETCWESAWRRLHQTSLCEQPQPDYPSATVGSILANTMVFELFKQVTGVTPLEKKHPFYLLNIETLEGDWHSFIPHPLVGTKPVIKEVEILQYINKQSSASDSSQLLSFFHQITSKTTGIFHTWEEGDLKQLPFAQCKVQIADPLSNERAHLLPEIICIGYTHQEAQLEAGFTGIETYVSRLLEGIENPFKDQMENFGIGTGLSSTEGICRGIQSILNRKMNKQSWSPIYRSLMKRVHLSAIDDERCSYYLKMLTIANGESIIYQGEEVAGFPVFWVVVNEKWYAGIGLNTTIAFRNALKQAFMHSDSGVYSNQMELFISSYPADSQEISIPTCEEKHDMEMLLRDALKTLDKRRNQLTLYDLALEPFFKEKLGGVFGVSLEGRDFQ
ncbi:putative thiazole-containing bacteriocin maturation protein [Seinonella peptonophila]|uniref:Putative thiazole-containing bacteriocin maturation protein n=1 Tax=Seinonella peptonophila TaxID=112248 RepID=A0A1M4TZL3_9BACL|nr:putative thiazole-containing bacteriocin maturation protein [Seinonella peptonophila]SHE49787.1 putative thiazole-containing bacteriocin maturation protein [Seinonella peptonophila]